MSVATTRLRAAEVDAGDSVPASAKTIREFAVAKRLNSSGHGTAWSAMVPPARCRRGCLIGGQSDGRSGEHVERQHLAGVDPASDRSEDDQLLVRFEVELVPKYFEAMAQVLARTLEPLGSHLLRGGSNDAAEELGILC